METQFRLLESTGAGVQHVRSFSQQCRCARGVQEGHIKQQLVWHGLNTMPHADQAALRQHAGQIAPLSDTVLAWVEGMGWGAADGLV